MEKAGQSILQYEIMKRIAFTNHAVLYQVKHGDAVAALKIARSAKPLDTEIVTREYQILKDIKHPNIVEVFDYGQFEERSFFTLEYVAGMPINKTFCGYSRALIDALLQVVSALGVLHGQNLVHCDLNPENILYDASKKRAVLIDFGFAGEIDSAIEPAGTIGYIAPEVLKDIAIDQRSDVYSLGMIMRNIVEPEEKAGEGTSKEPEDLAMMRERMTATEPALRPNLPEIGRILAKHSSREEPIRLQCRINTPTTVYVELPEIRRAIDAHKSGLLVLRGENGTGKTRIIKELKFKFSARQCPVFHYSAKEHVSLLDALLRFTGIRKTDAAKNDKFQIFELLCGALRKIARPQQLIVLLDEIENFTQYELELLHYLVYGLSNSNALFIGAVAHAAPIPVPAAEQLDVRCFDPGETNSLIARTYVPIRIFSGSDTPGLSRFTKWLHAQTNGNPLFIVELLRSLNAQGILSYQNDEWNIDLQRLNRAKVPEHLENLIEQKIKGLNKRQLLILELTAFSDTPLPVTFLGMMLAENADADIAMLSARGLLHDITDGSRHCVYVPNHFMKSALHKRLSDLKKKGIGQKMIRLIKSTGLAEQRHYVRVCAQFAEPTNTQEAAEYLTAAANNAERVFDYDQAINYLSRAQRIYRRKDIGKYRETAVHIAELHYKNGANDKAMRLYQEMLGAACQNIRARASAGIGRIHSMTGKYEDAIQYLEKALKEKPGKKDRDYLTISNQIAYALISTHQFDRAAKALNANLKQASRLGDNEQSGDALCYQAVNEWHKNNLKLAIQKAGRALDFAKRHKMDIQTAYAEGILSSLFQRAGSYQKSQAHINAAIAVYEKMNLVNSLGHALLRKANTQMMLGELNAAIELYHSVMIRACQIKNDRLLCFAQTNLAAAYVERGDFNAALEYYQKAAKHYPHDLYSGNGIAWVKLIQGHIAESKELITKQLNSKNAPANAFALAALIYLADQDRSKAGAMIKKAADLLNSENYDHHVFLEICKIAVMYYLESCDYSRALEFSGKIIARTTDPMIARIWAEAVTELCRCFLAEKSELDLEQALLALKTREYLYDYALIGKWYFQALLSRGKNDIASQNIRLLDQIAEIFARIGAEPELPKIKEMLSVLRPALVSEPSGIDYLRIFSSLATIVHNDLGDERFAARILDLIIEATDAERGALFLTALQGMKLSCGRNIDKITLQDAAELSSTAVQEAGSKGIIYTYNARSDPEYNTRRSVILNKIRAIMCIPLFVDNETIGAVYVDSRVKDGIFNARDESFLLSVCQILASVIQKSIAFARLNEEKQLLEEQLIKDIGTGYLLGKSAPMKKVYRLVRKIAATNAPVLILGETGTGKGMLARYIHSQSRRKTRYFQIINCGTIPENLLESELFGHKKGSFTSAVNDKPGLMEEAQGGTIFLDEITNTSPAFQAKILEAIEDKKIRRVGDTKSVNIDVRFLFATNQNLDIEVEENRFRKDLFYRINVFTIEVPALRDRSQDIPVLAQYFIERVSREISKKITGFTAEALKKIKNYQWPGNVRELQNVIERAVVLAKGDLITARDLFLGIGPDELLPLTEIKKESLIEALNVSGHNITHTARILGLNRKTVQRYMKKHSIKK